MRERPRQDDTVPDRHDSDDGPARPGPMVDARYRLLLQSGGLKRGGREADSAPARIRQRERSSCTGAAHESTEVSARGSARDRWGEKQRVTRPSPTTAAVAFMRCRMATQPGLTRR